MEDPAAGAIAEPALSHPIKKELEEPDGAGQGGEKIVIEQRRLLIDVVAEGFVACIEQHAPNKVCRQAAPKQDDVGDVVLVEEFGGDSGMRLFPEGVCGLGHGRAGFDAIIETGAEDARDGADDEAFCEVEFLDAFFLFFLGEFFFF